MDQIAGALVLLHAARRSRSVPALRPAAVSLAAFVLLDAARLAGLPWALDVVAFCAMPACWAALLVSRRWALPILAAFLYASLLLSLPKCTASWSSLLQLPRVVTFAGALGVALSRRILPPSRAVGVALGLASGIGVSAGLWASWGGVRALSLTAWIMVAIIIAHARQPDPA